MKREKVALIVGLGLAIALLTVSAFAADMPVKAKKDLFGSSYPSQRCGLYYGVGTGGSSGQVNDSAPGTRIVQGQLDAILGYSCPFGQAGFWFVEGSIGFNNLNGAANGFALSGPLVAMQRAGAGSPINQLFGNSAFLGNLALPSLPALPSGVTAGPVNGYFFVGLVEQDVAQQLALDQHTHVWLVAPMIGVGGLTRLSDGVVIDTWAGWQMNTQSFCSNAGGSCARLGNAARVGVSFKF